ncbi:hypothetical protein KCP73_16930 [Salmonella enterica subsp. enterica]|nr:hypothetical protein KCP73_16930 [Salmonella enterica subsp. enterica]
MGVIVDYLYLSPAAGSQEARALAVSHAPGPAVGNRSGVTGAAGANAAFLPESSGVSGAVAGAQRQRGAAVTMVKFQAQPGKHAAALACNAAD